MKLYAQFLVRNLRCTYVKYSSVNPYWWGIPNDNSLKLISDELSIDELIIEDKKIAKCETHKKLLINDKIFSMIMLIIRRAGHDRTWSNLK